MYAGYGQADELSDKQYTNIPRALLMHIFISSQAFLCLNSWRKSVTFKRLGAALFRSYRCVGMYLG